MKQLLLIVSLLFLGATGESHYVYVCTGSYSKCYHKTSECEGLKYCSKEIKKVTLDEALKMNRKPCKYCYGDK